MSVPRHTAYNAAGALVPVAVMAVALPPYLSAIGEARYGVLAVLWTLLGYLGLFDLGLGRAVANRIAGLHAETARQREGVFWTALVLNLALGTAVGVVLWALATVAFDMVVVRLPSVSQGLAAEARAALPWMALGFPLLLASSVMQGALMGREEFLHQNAVKMVEGALVQLAPLAVALAAGPELVGLVQAVMAVRALGALVLLVLCIRRLPAGLRPHLVQAEVRPLFVYGGWVTVTSTVAPLLSALDRVMIGAISGARAVTYYTVPFGVVTQLTVLPGSLTVALFPRFSAVMEPAERDALQAKGMRSVAAAVTPLVVIGLLVAEPGLSWWLGPEFAARSTPVALLLLPGIWANCLAYVPFGRLQGSGRPDLSAKAHAVELLPYLVLLWLGLQTYGVAGAAAAWSLRTTIDLALLWHLSGMPLRAVRSIAGDAVLVVAATALVWLNPGVFVTLGVGGGLAVLALWGSTTWLWPLMRPLRAA